MASAVAADVQLEVERSDAGAPKLEEAEVPSELAEYVVWALEKAGVDGRFQRNIYAVYFTLCCALSMQMMVQVFTTLPALQADSQKPFTDEDCLQPPVHRDFVKPFSVSSEFGLVCEYAMEAPLLGTLYFVGMLFGVSSCGVLADRRGRWVGCMLSFIVHQVGGLLALLSPIYTVYAVARFLVGFGYGGVSVAAYVWFSEFMGDRGRRMLIVWGGGIGFGFGCILMSPIAYWVPDWRMMTALVFVLGCPVLCVLPLLPESPAWYVTQQRCDDVHRVICRIAIINGRSQPPPYSSSGSVEHRDETKREDTPGALKQLLCDPRLSQRFLPLCLGWFACALGYFGIVMNASNVGVSVYWANVVSVLTELPCGPFALWAVGSSWIGRKGCIVGGLIFGGTCCLLCAPAASPDVPPAVLVGLVYVGKFAIAASFNSLYVWVAELFPTAVRSQSLGFQSLCGRIGGIIAPSIADLGRSSTALPLIIFGAPAFIAGLLLVRLPETRGQRTPDSIDDLPPAGALLPCLRRYAQLEEEAEGKSRRSSEPAPSAVVVGNQLKTEPHVGV